MIRTGMSCRAIAGNLNISHSVVSRLVCKHAETGHVRDRSRSGRPKNTSVRDDRALVRLVQRAPRVPCGILRRQWRLDVQVSMSTVRRRLHANGLHVRAYRPVRRPLRTARHMQERLRWCRARSLWNIRSWRRVHFPDDNHKSEEPCQRHHQC